jgi:ubiquinone/menaquinone biosynthesis C-methylase UbiE
MKLNAGCGGNQYDFLDLGCDINCDLQKPKLKIPNFVMCDLRHLPFKDEFFQSVYAFNVLEHIPDYKTAVRELKRVSSDEVFIRFDKLFNLANWFTADHEALQVQKALVSFPTPVKWIIKLVRFPINNSETFQSMIHRSFPVLRKLGLLDKWNYYRIK